MIGKKIPPLLVDIEDIEEFVSRRNEKGRM